MRTRWLVLALCPLSIQAQTVRDSVVTVTATRTARIAPDRASFFLSVEGSAETATDAVARAETKLQRVGDALRGVSPRVEFERPLTISVGPTNRGGYPSAASPLPQTARAVIRVHVARLEQVAPVIAAALEAGAGGTFGMSYESSAADSVRRERTAQAIAGAREEAAAVARALGVRLGGLADVSVGGGPIFQTPSSFNFDVGFSQSTPAPEVIVTSSVTLRYRLIP